MYFLFRKTCLIISTPAGDTLSIDLKDFYTEFYCILLKLITCSPAEQTELIPLTISCLQLMLYERRQLSMDRVAAFVKRVLIIALQLQPNASIAMLVVVRDLLRVSGRSRITG